MPKVARSRQRRRGWALLALALVALAASPVLADGSQTGVVTGIVVDQGGSGLEGVAVTLSGPRSQRTAFTDARGRFRFPSLGPGGYAVRAELLGLEAADPAVRVHINRTTEIRLTLGEAAATDPEGEAQEWIEVVAEAPVIDKYDSRVGANLSFDFLDELPVQRFYQSVALALPGVVGGEDGNPNVSGALRGSNLFLIDGVDTTDPTTGLFGLNLGYELVQEVGVTTAAPSTEYGRHSGAVIDVVTRSGTNRYEGSVRWVASDASWNDDYAPPEADTAHLAADLFVANLEDEAVDSTIAFSLGGPLLPRHLWFFTAFEDTESAFLAPVAGGPFWDQDARLESLAGKLTAQAGPQHGLVLQHTADAARFVAFAPLDRGPSENRASPSPIPLRGSVVGRLPGDVFALEEQSQDGDFTKLQWNWVPNQSLSVELRAAEQRRELARRPRNRRGLTADAPHVVVTDFVFPPGAEEPDILAYTLFNGITDAGTEQRDRRQGNLSLHGFLSRGATEHELRGGIDYQEVESEERINVPGLPGIDRATGRPVAGQVFVDLDLRPPCLLAGRCESFDRDTGTFQPLLLLNFWERQPVASREEIVALHLSDTVARDRWVLSVGARYERLEGKAGDAAELVSDESLAPRLSFTFDAAGDGKALLTLTAGRFYEPFLLQYLDSFARSALFSGFTEYTWAGITFPECAGADPTFVDSPCWFPTNASGFTPVQAAPPNPDLRRSYVDEWTLGFERQITPTTAVRLHYVDREWGNLWDNVFTVVRDAQGNVVGAQSRIENLLGARREYRAIQLLVQRRFADRWQLLGSYAWAEAEGNLFQNDGLATFADFRDVFDLNVANRFGAAPYDRRHRLRLFGNYQIPFERLNLSLGSVLRYESGVPFQREALDDLGVRFLSPRGSERLSEIFQWDLSLAADLRLGQSFELRAKAEIFNLTGEEGVLGVETVVDTGLDGRPRDLADLQTPRTYRLTLGLRF